MSMKKLFFGYFLYNDVVVFKVFNRNHNDSRQKIKINKQTKYKNERKNVLVSTCF